MRHPGHIAVCVCIVASVACGDGLTGPAPPRTPSTVVFGGRVVDADAGGPVGNVRVSLYSVAFSNGTSVLRSTGPRPDGWVFPTDTATSGGDGTFTLPLNLPRNWRIVYLHFTGPGYDDRSGRFEPTAAPCRISPCWAATAVGTTRLTARR